ncbi:MAG: cupin domain-containing protein [Clostridia bacterium]|nr:cupin domain-containing protein [Clostridia bacterium]
MGNYIDDNKEKIQQTPGGALCQVFGANEGASCSVALVTMNENSKGLKHYHDNITEIYVFNKGEGKIIINGNEHIVSNGDCFIIPPKTIHFIETITQMEFVCICTPPWTPEHEFVTEDVAISGDTDRCLDYGALQNLSNEKCHSVFRIKLEDDFVPDYEMKKFTRVYYFINGNGIITVDGVKYEIKQGDCFLVNETSDEIINSENKIEFILVCDRVDKI